MKKLLLLLAVCGLVVACGGEKKEDKKSGEQKTEQKAPAKEVEQEAPAEENLTVAQLFDAMYDALQNNDEDRFVELAVTVDSWGDELTPEQEKELEAYLKKSPEKMMAVIEAVEEIDFDELYAVNDDYDYEELSDYEDDEDYY